MEVTERVLEVVLAHVPVRSLRAGDEIRIDAEGVRPRRGPHHAVGE